jgi:hypothetical protein
MFATDSDGKEPLMTFRIPRRLDELNAGESMEAESLGDHRPRYLHYEGPLSDNRGSVKRIATGQLRASHNEAGESEYEIHWDSGTAQGRVQRILLQKSPKGTLTLFCVS